MGLDSSREGEEHDRDDLGLPGQQENLVMSVAKAARKPVVLVVLCGGPVDISFAKNESKIGSIVWAGYPGEAGGLAVAEVIFGDHNPGGRLPLTWYPKDFTKIPMTNMNMRPNPSSGYPGRTYRFYQGEKVFEFGYGLSYSNYSYKFVSVSQTKLQLKSLSKAVNGNQNSGSISGTGIPCEKAKFSVVVSVENVGTMPGKHPILLFLRRDKAGDNESPVKQLIGFQTVSLRAKGKASITFQVNPCEHFSSADKDGNLVIMSGDQSLVVGDQQFPISII